MNNSSHAILDMAKAVIKTQAEGILELTERLDASFVAACQLILQCKGRVVVTGMGKSGHIASKIAATLASTGTPAFFVHPAEASHGDLGMIVPGDVILAMSNSGETDELLLILPIIKRLGIPLIAMTGRPSSSLAENASVHLDVSVENEACPLGLAPTTSTTATLVMGDALAVSLLEARGFTEEDFARSHPAGALGRRLLLHISDIMHTGEKIPTVHQEDTLANAILEMTQKGLGMTAVVDKNNKLLGIITDGDLRRTIESGADFQKLFVSDLMNASCKTIDENQLAVEAAELMESHKINSILVTNDELHLKGALNIHDLFRARVI